MANRVQEERQSRGWSLEKLAVEADISKETVRNIETGRTRPAFGTAVAIARAFGMGVEDVFPAEEAIA